MSSPNMNPIWPSVNFKRVELATVAAFILLGIFLVNQSYSLGAGYGPSGPEPGFWPFWLTMLYMLGSIGILVYTLKNPDDRPFFEVKQEVIDLLSVGLPILVSVFLIEFLGVFVTSALYLAFFMTWYGQFKWYTSIVSGLVFATVLWFMLRMGFNLSMPMSWLYYENITPF